MTLTAAERERRIKQYADGPARLRAAVEAVPPDAMKWRPAPDEFSVHEIVVHCADSETNAAARIRYIMAEKEPVIVGYDPDTWASRFDYHSHPLDVALATIEAVRANTVPVIERLNAGAWRKAGTHSESGRYTGNDWLSTYSEHLEEHIAQIKRTVSAWRAAGSPRAAE
jgi:hypothetical protein